MMFQRRLLVLVGITVFAAILFCNTTESSAARNPFISSKQNKPSSTQSPMSGYPAFLKPLMDKIAAFQYAIKQKMVRFARDIRQHPFGRSFWGFMLLSFVYGVVHALGPGHGKIYTCSYFLSRPGTLKKVLLFGNLTMLMHVISGTVLILFGALILKRSGAMTLENSGPALERFSYAMLVGVGLFIMGKIIHEMRSNHGHGHQCPDQADMKSLILTALAVGIVPCPGAALILLFSLTLGILSAGLWGMLCIAAGMAITTSIFALGAIGFRKAFTTIAEGNDRMVAGIHGFFSFGGALCICLLGFLLFLNTF